MEAIADPKRRVFVHRHELSLINNTKSSVAIK